MAIRVVLALVLLVAVMWFASWLNKATPQQRSQAFKLVILYGVVGLVLLMVVLGRIPWLFAIAGAALPWIQRAIMAQRAWHSFKAFRGPRPGQSSSVNTTWLAMTLDHDSGEMDGKVLQGTFAGKALGDLGIDQLIDLLIELRSRDPQSVPLLEAYMDRAHGDAWREREEASVGGESHASHGEGPMSRQEALSILGLEEGANKEEIVAAHRRLMQKFHPDRGGNDYLAARINQAKDLLIEKQA